MSYKRISPMPLIEGGTNASLTASNGGIVYSSSTALGILSGTATADQVLLSGSSTTPLWSTATYPVSTTINQLLYSSSANTIAGLATANSGVLITSSGGVPSISSTLPLAVQTNITELGTVTVGTWNATLINPTYGGTGVNNGSSTITVGGNTAFSGAFTFTGTITANTSVTFPTSGTLATTSQIPSLPLSLSNGGTNANLTASNGGIFYSTASAGAILSGTATARQMLQSGASGAPAWSTATYPATTTINQLLYSSAANTVSGISTANSGVLVTNSSGVPAFSSTMTNGQLIIGSTSGTPTAATLTAGNNVTITNGSGSITIAASLTNAVTQVGEQVFTSSGTYTPTSGMLYCIIECWGGGGAGGAATAPVTSGCCGGGGGAGGYSKKIVSAATIGSSQTVTIGTGGTGGTGNGPAGTATSVGTLCIANGGGGGNAGSGSSGGAPGSGGTAGTGDVTGVGAPGQGGIGFTSGLAVFYSSAGGSTAVGGGGKGVTTASVTAGNAATGYGSGGGAAAAINSSSTGNGGSGASGLVVITEFI